MVNPIDNPELYPELDEEFADQAVQMIKEMRKEKKDRFSVIFSHLKNSSRLMQKLHFTSSPSV